MLPHRWQIERLGDVGAVFAAIRDMAVRGAPLIGVTAAYGLAQQANLDASDEAFTAAASQLRSSRPTAVNLGWALARMQAALLELPVPKRAEAAWRLAAELADEDVATSRAIGEHGFAVLRELAERHPGRQPGFRCHPRAAGHRPH